VSDEEARLRQELLQLDAQAALAQADLPKADEIAATCRQFAEGVAEATPAQRRDILDVLEVQVTMQGWTTRSAAWCLS
jgi:hypothetical protein